LFKAKARTKRELEEFRKREKLADSSYDLDGDGIVGGQEYVIAKRFDKNKDGKLEAEERVKALEALHSGFEDEFFWGLEKHGSHRGRRMLQVRGKIIDAEDFSLIRDTYPAYPRLVNSNEVTTLTELKAKRYKEQIFNLEENRKKWNIRHPNKVIQHYAKSEFLIDFPKFFN